MMPTLLLATNNPGKLKEMQAILATLLVNLTGPQSLGINIDVVEDGNTYAENARRKALAFSMASGLTTLADDFGLEVDVLDGQPGLFSHRFAPWPNASDSDRRRLLLERLEGKARPWTAHFHCTVAIALPDGNVCYTEGECTGEIIPEERGSNGFGYDPVFYISEYKATMAELDLNIKNQISHRARALQAALPVLQEILEINPHKPG